MKEVYVAMYFVDNGYGENAYDLEDVAVFNNENDAKEWAEEKENEYDYVEIVKRKIK